MVVLGEFKRGKSTLVNALVETDVVPTGVLPLTAAVTAVRHGAEPRLLVSLAAGGRHELPLGQIADFATETGNPGNRRGVRLLTIELPAPLLAVGIQLVDTPGIGSIHAHNTETSLAFLAQVDAALFTLAADQPLSGAEEVLVREAAQRIPQIFFALNKLDHLVPDEHEETIEFVRERLRAVLESEPELYPLSARSGEGLATLRRRLPEFGVRERKAVLAHSVRALAAAFAAEAVQAVRFEAHTVELPLAELERRLSDFRQQAERLARVRQEVAELLVHAARRLTAERVNEPLLSLAAREGPALLQGLRAAAAGSGKIAPRVLAERLDAWIDSTIQERFERIGRDLEREIAHELGEFHVRYAQRVDRILGELDEAAAHVLAPAPVDARRRCGCAARRSSPSSCTTSASRSTSSPRSQPARPPARSGAAGGLRDPIDQRTRFRRATRRLAALARRPRRRLPLARRRSSRTRRGLRVRHLRGEPAEHARPVPR